MRACYFQRSLMPAIPYWVGLVDEAGGDEQHFPHLRISRHPVCGNSHSSVCEHSAEKKWVPHVLAGSKRAQTMWHHPAAPTGAPRGPQLLTMLVLAAAMADSASAEWTFAHGVASGDPLSDRIILWTR